MSVCIIVPTGRIKTSHLRLTLALLCLSHAFTVPTTTERQVFIFNQEDMANLTLSVLELKTSCDVGLLALSDHIVLSGTVLANESVRAVYEEFISLEMSDGPSPCMVDLTLCQNRSEEPGCFCVSSTTTTVELYFKVVARTQYSSANTYLRWTPTNPAYPVQLSNSLELQNISDVTTTKHSLKVNGHECTIGGGNNPCQFLLGLKNTIEYCCLSDVKPCETWIEFDGIEMASGSPCAAYSLTPKDITTIKVSVVTSLCDDAKETRLGGQVETVLPNTTFWNWWRLTLTLSGSVAVMTGAVGLLMWRKRSSTVIIEVVEFSQEEIELSTPPPVEEEELRHGETVV